MIFTLTMKDTTRDNTEGHELLLGLLSMRMNSDQRERCKDIIGYRSVEF